ncbi:NmrA/HSCARG family protein [Streptomyces sp. NBC_00582]|uniref:NmrA/HSCARG family protein n=1 Tax=Streptomyces sp. NBC_00582 TaxID=2975783 RepID=UPI001064434D|nr:NmrA/HSCARG family protein [Streptomyces sp. NBC_00582]WUB59370.1 NmrA/HSCARG family protein [Streptomyces sp. NBC_00582]
MSENKVIAVVGATGAQGGSLVEAILEHPGSGLTVRALTRNPDSEKAKALASRGIEVVRGDADDPGSLESAFTGAHGAFLVTNFNEHGDAARETAQAKAMADAVKKAGVRHVVWSTLEDTRGLIADDDPRFVKLEGGRYLLNSDSKGEADGYFRELGVPTTFMRTCFFWENLFGPMFLRRGDDGALLLTIAIGDALLPGVSVKNIGRFAFGIFTHPEFIGRTVGVANAHLTGADMADTLARLLGEEVRYEPYTLDALRALDMPMADTFANLMQFKQAFNAEYVGARDLDVVRVLNPEVETFDQWVSEHKDQLKAR